MPSATPDQGARTMPADSPDGAEEPLLRVEHARIGYRVDREVKVAVEDVSFDIHLGESVMLLGPSGCGKSTLLKAIAGYQPLVSGHIGVSGRTSLSPGPDRAMVFQEFDQLFPWRTVLDNVVFPLVVNGSSKERARQVAFEFLEMLGMQSAAEKFPHQLSGGMKQRVAIARAFALDPLMLLMDEPFGSLDAQTRARLQRELVELASRTGVTILFVTHSIHEAIVLGDQVVVLSAAPSTVRDVVDVSTLNRPDQANFASTSQLLRTLLAHDGQEADDVFFE